MFMILREENGLTYSSYAYTDFFEHMGDFKMYAECDSSKVFKNGSGLGVFPLLCKMICDLLKNGVSDDEMKTAKGFIEGSQKMNAEDPYVIAKYNGKNLLFGTINAPKYMSKYKKLIEPITKENVNDCIKKYFRKEGMVVSVVSSNQLSEKSLRKVVDKYL
jgi:predicted Zn-dependent peptidase